MRSCIMKKFIKYYIWYWKDMYKQFKAYSDTQ